MSAWKKARGRCPLDPRWGRGPQTPINKGLEWRLPPSDVNGTVAAAIPNPPLNYWGLGLRPSGGSRGAAPPWPYFLALFLAAPAIAASHEDPARVAAVVSEAAAQVVPPGAGVVLGPVGGAAVMARCPGALSAVVTGVAPYEQAAVRCAGLGWTLFVSLTVTQSAQVVVAARPVAAGQALGPADVVLRSEDVSAYAGRRVFYNVADVLGADPLMNLAAGAILTANAVETPVLVKAGQTVAVQVKAGAVEVSVNAVADETGRAGDEVMFTNPATGKRFEALLTAAGPVLQL